MKKGSRELLLIVAAVCINAGCFAGIAAYLMAKDSADNTMTVGHNAISIMEEFIPPDKLEPGVVIPKKVNIQNTGDVPCAVRVSAEFSDSDMKNAAKVDVDDRYWEYKSDGYYYYKEILEVADISHTLFNTVTISQDVKPSQLKDFDIMVSAESRNAEKGMDYGEIRW